MPERSYRPVDPHVSWPAMEAEVAARWQDKDVFPRTLSNREGSPEWVFYDGPPTANNKPGIHHVEPRAFKDVYCRFQVMRGHYVHRKAGWDCHGLPVEIEVEKSLGITQKREIEEKVGIEEFTRLCRESVQRYVDDHARLTERIGYWVDQDNAYWTMSRDYVESVWWILKQIWDKGLLEEDFKVVPYCPRCETALSSHEQHQTDAYKDVVDPSVFVRFPLAADPSTALLVWTTTPWTLLANMAAAVGPDITYVRVADPHNEGASLIVARERVEALLGEGVEVFEEIHGGDLVGRIYSPPFGFVESGETGHRVRPGDFVTTEDGTGIVHLAPYGEADMEVAKRDGLPIVGMIDASGKVVPRGEPFGGLWVKDADPKIIEDLDGRGLLFKAEDYEHAYPHCWRCSTPLLYYPRRDWYVRTSQIRGELQASNEDTNWQPPTIKHGRFGDWLANNVDWSLSRDRYWGTPLPVWRCEAGHATCVGSIAELAEHAGRDLSDLDPHRPYVDEVTITCPECHAEARRVKSVIDAWFDSGSMPFAQWHYPFENEDVFETRFPADFISEAIDQTRGWFYSLLAVATLVRGGNSYRNVVCLGHIVDTQGRKMSKSLGNVIDPWVVLDAQGADPLRWYLLTSGSPWSARRVSVELIEETLRKYLLTLWNTYSFWVTYASLEGFDPSAHEPVADRPQIDRWILAELDDTVREVTDSLEAFDCTRGGRRLDRFVDDPSNWYVRRSRRRFWRSASDEDTKTAFLTLHECLVTVAKLAAPYTPFVADEIYTNLTGEDSVHLADWPEPDGFRSDDDLRRRMQLVRRLVSAGRSARTDAKVRVRQPLAKAVVVLPAAEADDLAELEELLAEELNVKQIEVARGLAELVTYTVKPNFKTLGPRFGKKVKDVAAALGRADAYEVVASLERDGTTTLEVDGEHVSLAPGELDVRVSGREGFSLAQDGPYGVALDLEVTPELAAEGAAREVVRAVQDLRKSSGLAVEDRIELWLASDDDAVTAALRSHEEMIAREVLAVGTAFDAAPEDAAGDDVELDGGSVRVGLRKSR
ncbi:MAG TPA: isoleucine--tRNA ligase [Actinomycetota bacterium]|nr:isoleucine--tRNA ligase [Actinomycetota bacterium]